MDASYTAGPKTVVLIIRSPDGAHDDQVIDGVGINWTIEELKAHLSVVYPSKPPEKDQRLIYCGKLLLDHLHVSDVFIKSEATPIVHLVCTFRPPKAQPKGMAAEQKDMGSSSLGSGPAQQSVASPPAAPQRDGLRNRGQSASLSSAGTVSAGSGFPVTQPVFPTYSLYSPLQLRWLQQVYAQQYYMQYQAALAGATSSNTSMTHSTSHCLPVDPQPAAAPAALPDQPANQNVPEPRLINPAGANQNLRMNAQGGPVMEEDGAEHDWLEWMYTATRLSVFMGIVYFYSNLSRFILVMSSLLFMYLHTVGWFPFRRVPLVPGPREQAAEEVQNQDGDPEVEVPTGGADVAEDGESVQPFEAAVSETPQSSIIQTAWVFFKTFFASLVPDIPQDFVN